MVQEPELGQQTLQYSSLDGFGKGTSGVLIDFISFYSFTY